MNEDLRAAEQAAGGAAPSQVGDGLGSARENEEQAGGLYTGASSAPMNPVQKSRFRGVFKKNGPAFAIIFMIFGFGGMMGATQLFQPFSLLAQFTETFNTMHTSVNFRTRTFLKLQLGGNVKNPVKGSRIFGTQRFKISETQAARLKAQDIDYDADAGTLTFTKMVSTDHGEEITTRVVTAGEFESVYRSDPDFFNAYNRGSMTWRGAIANWFGTMTMKFLRGNSITRNLFRDFQEKTTEADGNSRETALKLMAERDTAKDGGFRNSEEVKQEETKTVTENGQTTTKTTLEPVNPQEIAPSDGSLNNKKYELEDSGSTDRWAPVTQDASSDASTNASTVRSKLDDISGMVSKGANIACTISNLMGAVTLLVTAHEALQIISLTTSYFEAIDKVKAGYGDESPIHDLTNALNETHVNEHATLVFKEEFAGRDLDSGDNIREDGIQALATETSSSKKTAMNSAGVVALYGGGRINPNDPSVKSFNFSNSINRIFGGIGVSMAGFKTCAVAKIAANGISAATGALETVGCLLGLAGAAFTFGVSASACAGLGWRIAKSIAFSVAIGVTVAAVISTITPMVANIFKRDLISRIGGEDLGNALTAGANRYLGDTHRSNGGSLASADKYREFAVAQQEVIAENAKYERQTRDPFDITSKYTFMGTLLTQMMSFLAVNSVMGVVSSTSSVVSSSIARMSPTALAYDIANDLPTEEEYEETCPYLASIGAVGDPFCRPYTITDISTMNVEPQETIDKLDEWNAFLEEETEDGNVIVNGKSELAKHILYCNSRSSEWGIVDPNIVSAVSSWGSVETESATFNNVVNSAVGATFIGDVIDVIQNKDALDNVGYISGESCVAGNTVDASESPNWEKAKYYQRFVEDQSLSEAMGLVEKSAATAFLEDYYKENPLDNSYEGILARYAGLTKETVVALLDVFEYFDYVANYDASERYAFKGVKTEESQEILFDNNNELANLYFIMPREISFSDVRNRSFAV